MSIRVLRERMHRLFALLNLVLREIFDEAAYARYLQRDGASASPESYAGFLHEKHCGKSPVRCC